jgi:Polysaccharide lyase
MLLGVPVAQAEVVWRGDFETGDLSQWTKSQQVAPDRMQVVQSPVRQGKYALRVEVRQGDDPLNASGDRAELVWSPVETEGNDRYYSWSTMWAPDFPSEKTWQAFTQWHHTGDTGTPPFEMYVNGETMYLAIGPDETVLWTHPLERGAWHDFILHVKWSSDPGVGFVELWYDGQQELRKTSGQTMFPGQDNIMKQGLYRNKTISEVGVLYHDGMTVGTSLEDVQPQAAAAAAGTTAGGTASQPAGTATGTGGGAAADNSGAPAGSGGCSAAGASGRRGLGGAGGLALALLGISFALRGALRRRRARARTA